jgi:hypothetical protein
VKKPSCKSRPKSLLGPFQVAPLRRSSVARLRRSLTAQKGVRYRDLLRGLNLCWDRSKKLSEHKKRQGHFGPCLRISRLTNQLSYFLVLFLNLKPSLNNNKDLSPSGCPVPRPTKKDQGCVSFHSRNRSICQHCLSPDHAPNRRLKTSDIWLGAPVLFSVLCGPCGLCDIKLF